MKYDAEPPRLTDSMGTPAELRQLLGQAAHSGYPAMSTAELLGAVERRLLTDPPGIEHLVGEPLGQSLASKAGLFGLRGAAFKWMIGSVVVVSAATYFGVQLRVRHSREPRPAVAAVINSLPEPVLSTSLNGAASAKVESGGIATTDEGESARLVEVSAPEKSSAPKRVGRSASIVSGRGASSGKAAREAVLSNPPESSTSEEYALLRAARRALSSNPQQALQLAEQHQRQYPRGMLVQEREAIRIEALSATGRTADVNRLSGQFLKQFPKSPYRNRIEGLIGTRRTGAAAP